MKNRESPPVMGTDTVAVAAAEIWEDMTTMFVALEEDSGLVYQFGPGP